MFKTLFAWLGALGMTVLAARLIVSAVDAPTDGEAALANFGAFASCSCGLVLFVLGLALRPSATDQVHTNTRQHAFTNRLSTEDAGSGVVVDFTSGAKGGENANNLSAALAEHYGSFGMGYEARVVGEERTSPERSAPSSTWAVTLLLPAPPSVWIREVTTMKKTPPMSRSEPSIPVGEPPALRFRIGNR